MGTIRELTGGQFLPWFSKYGPRTNSISFTGNSLGMQILRSHSTPTESETLRVGLAICFNKLSR